MGSRFLLRNSNIREPTMFDPLKTLMHRLTNHTVLSDLLDPVSRALARVRKATVGHTLRWTPLSRQLPTQNKI